ncbi:MAG: hypothetical protein Q8N23_23330 [Archangium sp.]|nr:hypothetical protein [Archangium sp.]MDP3570770.1 hypothetical protein [Archangium sp.]
MVVGSCNDGVGGGGGCTKTGEERDVSADRQALRDLSNVPVGTGYDRALDVVRADCFDRGAPTSTPINKWNATGFTVFSNYEITTKAKTALKVGVKIYGVDYTFGSNLSSQITAGNEQSYFVMLARFESHTDRAGEVNGADPTSCGAIENNSSNSIPDFVSVCGDAFLAEKKVWWSYHDRLASKRLRPNQGRSIWVDVRRQGDGCDG